MTEKAALRVLILNWRDPSHPSAGGAERYLVEIGRRFVERHHRVEWLTAGFPGAPGTSSIDGIPITRVGNRFTVYLAIPIAYLRRFRKRFDVVIDAENGIPFFSPLFAVEPQLCLMFHVHQRVFEKHLPVPISNFFKWVEARVMPFVYRRARFVAISRDTKRELQTLGIRSDRIDLAVSGIDASLAPGTKAERPTVLYLGRLKAYKRVDVLLRAFPAIRSIVPGAELVIAGSGDRDASLRALAQQLGIAESVRFEGSVSDDRKRALMQAAWVFAMPSEMEGWGLTIVEANACGTPCVGFAVPGVGESIVDGVSGVLVDEGTAMAPAIARILADESLRARLAEGAVRHARAFSWDATVDAFRDVMQSEFDRVHSQSKASRDDR